MSRKKVFRLIFLMYFFSLAYFKKGKRYWADQTFTTPNKRYIKKVNLLLKLIKKNLHKKTKEYHEAFLLFDKVSF